MNRPLSLLTQLVPATEEIAAEGLMFDPWLQQDLLETQLDYEQQETDGGQEEDQPQAEEEDEDEE